MKKILLLVFLATLLSCNKKGGDSYKDLSVIVWYEIKPSNTILRVPDVGAKCYVFKNFDIHSDKITTNLNGTISLSNGSILNSSESFVYDGGIHYVKNVKVGSYITVLIVSNKYPTRIKTTTELIKVNDPILPINTIETIFGLYDM